MHKYQISRKSFQWEPSCSMRTDRQRDRHDEADSRFSQFCERAQNSANNEHPVFCTVKKRKTSALKLSN